MDGTHCHVCDRVSPEKGKDMAGTNNSNADRVVNPAIQAAAKRLKHAA
jgi:hypothetical protein